MNDEANNVTWSWTEDKLTPAVTMRANSPLGIAKGADSTTGFTISLRVKRKGDFSKNVTLLEFYPSDKDKHDMESNALVVHAWKDLAILVELSGGGIDVGQGRDLEYKPSTTEMWAGGAERHIAIVVAHTQMTMNRTGSNYYPRGDAWLYIDGKLAGKRRAPTCRSPGGSSANCASAPLRTTRTSSTARSETCVCTTGPWVKRTSTASKTERTRVV